MIIADHPFEAGDVDAQRCERPIGNTALCGAPRAEHARTAAVPVRERRPVHPRDTDVYQATTRVGGVDVAVDEAGCLVMHVVAAGAYTITNLDGFIADLELARNHAKRFEREPDAYRPGQPPREPLDKRPSQDGA